MTTVLATVIDGKELLETVIASFVAGVGLTAAFSLLIFGAARFADMRREDKPLLMFLSGVVALVGLAATLGGVAFGLSVMLAG